MEIGDPSEIFQLETTSYVNISTVLRNVRYIVNECRNNLAVSTYMYVSTLYKKYRLLIIELYITVNSI